MSRDWRLGQTEAAIVKSQVAAAYGVAPVSVTVGDGPDRRVFLELNLLDVERIFGFVLDEEVQAARTVKA